jgi:tRNA threonylcarbamoyladenosine biosynthesis protein TsaE
MRDKIKRMTANECGGTTIVTRSAVETAELGRLIGARLARGTFVGLSGDLGGGKTTLTQGIARGLGIEANVTSPTFQLLREYQGRERLFHFDFYRLESGGDLLDLDVSGCMESGVVVAEWAEKFDAPAAASRIFIRFDWKGENSRRIEFHGASPDCAAVVDDIVREFRP